MNCCVICFGLVDINNCVNSCICVKVEYYCLVIFYGGYGWELWFGVVIFYLSFKFFVDF